MAVLAIGLVGAFAGYAIGGTILFAQIGFMVGTMIGNALFPPPAQEGPKLSDNKMTTSAYGQVVPWVFGRARVAVNVFWATDKVDHMHTDSTGKGGGSDINTHTYTVSAACLICEGPIAGIEAIYMNSILVYDGGSNSASGIINSSKISGQIRVYLGGEDQEPDPFMQAVDGVAYTPAYRGVAYLMLQDLDLTMFGSQFPNIEVILAQAGSATGCRMLSTGTYQMDSLLAGQYNQAGNGLYKPYSAAYATGGESRGYATIAAVHGNTFDLVSDGSLTNSPLFPTPIAAAYNDTRWTVDENGALVGQGSRTVELGFLGAVFVGYENPPGTPGLLQPYQSQWVGNAGMVQMFQNRLSPLLLGGQYLQDGGVWPCAYDAFVVDSYHGQQDNSGFMQGLRDNATGYINSVFPSQDGLLCLVCTGAVKGTSDAWHLMSFRGLQASYVKSGTLDAGVQPQGFGRQAGNFGFANGMLEEDGIHLWCLNNNEVFCFEIGVDQVMRTIFHDPNPPGKGGYSGQAGLPSTYATEGVLYLANNTIFTTYTRHATVAADTVLLSTIVSAICVEAGMLPTDFDVSQLTDEVIGVVYGNQMTYRSMLEVLRNSYFFDAVEVDGKTVFVKRGQALLADIPEDDMAARDGMSLDPPADQWKLSRQQELELPQTVAVDYYAAGAQMQSGTQYARRQVTKSQNAMKIQLPLAFQDNQAASIAAVNQWILWEGRTTFEWSTDYKWSHLCPTDVVRLHKDGESAIVRILKRMDAGNGIITWAGQTENPSVYHQLALGGIVKGGATTVVLPGPTEFVGFDAPALKDTMGTLPTVFMAANGYDTQWRGASLFQSFDGGASYADTGISFNGPTALGRASSVLAAPGAFGVFDEASSVVVFLSNSAAELHSDTELRVLAGSNWGYLGGEIIAWKFASLIAPRQYLLSGLLRGMKGTEDFAFTHAVGEPFVLLNADNMRIESVDSSLIGTDLLYKPATFGNSVGASRFEKVPFKARNMRPLMPVHVNATKSTASVNGDWLLGWTRRTRIGGDWRALVDVQVGETAETYDVEILLTPNAWPDMTGASVIRTFTGLTSPSCVYTLAQQTADFGGATPYITFNVYQTNTVVGRSPLVSANHFVYHATLLDGGPVVVGPSGPTPTIWLKFNGPSGSTTMTDAGSAGLPFTAHGGAAIDTSVFKWGGGSAAFNGSSAYVDTPANAAFDFSSMTGTMDFQLYENSRAVDAIVAGSWGVNPADRSFLVYPTTTGNLEVVLQPVGGGSYNVYDFPFPFIATTWEHVELDFDAGALSVYLDGVQIGSTVSVPSIQAPTQPLVLGRLAYTGTNYLDGKVDNFRIYKGVCKHTGPFTPPSTENQ